MFSSKLGVEMIHFIEFKESLGYSASSYLKFLRSLDDFLVAHDNPSELYRSIVEKWIQRKSTEHENGQKRRMIAIRVFALFLISRGKNAYVIPSEMIGDFKPYTPFIFSDKQLKQFLIATDSVQKSYHSPLKHLTIPTYFRLTLSCGLRPDEAKNLKRCNFNLITGQLKIENSKRHKDRIIPVAPDVLDYCIQYDREAERLIPDRFWFFSTQYGNRHGMQWLQISFQNCLLQAGIFCSNPKQRIYDLRHNYATRKLQQWLDEGKNLNVMLPYLSQYMGHTEFRDTAYYIHLLPERLVVSPGIDWQHLNTMVPEVRSHEQ